MMCVFSQYISNEQQSEYDDILVPNGSLSWHKNKFTRFENDFYRYYKNIRTIKKFSRLLNF